MSQLEVSDQPSERLGSGAVIPRHRMLDDRNRVRSLGQHQLVVLELAAGRRLDHPGRRIDRIDVELKLLDGRVSQQALEWNPPHPTDGVRLLRRNRVIDELVLGRDERDRDAVAGQRTQRHHGFERRHPASGDQHPHRLPHWHYLAPPATASRPSASAAIVHVVERVHNDVGPRQRPAARRRPCGRFRSLPSHPPSPLAHRRRRPPSQSSAPAERRSRAPP